MKGYCGQSPGLWRVKLEYNDDEYIQKEINNDGIEYRVKALLPEGTISDVVTFIHKNLNRQKNQRF